MEAYQQTPHASTGIAPVDMLFSNRLITFPRQRAGDNDVSHAMTKEKRSLRNRKTPSKITHYGYNLRHMRKIITPANILIAQRNN